jgi:hypothetical protein
MKKPYLYLLLVGLFLAACGGEDGPNEIDLGENTAPTVPSQVFPLNNTICTDNNVLFEWTASTDNEGNPITYKIEVSDESSFSTLMVDESNRALSSLITLDRGQIYYWRIKAIDNRSAESAYSDVMQFITEGEGISNHLPFAPTLLSPALDSEIEGTSVTINWTATDIDGDPLTFDVYLDTNENPSTLVSENQTVSTYDATGLSASTKYYFKIVVKDDKGGTSIGQVWSFITK